MDREEKLEEALRQLLQSEVGIQALDKLRDGQGTQTEDGKAWLAAKSLVDFSIPTGMQWPVRRDVARLDDMSPDGHLRVLLDSDNDVCVEVYDGMDFCTVEFCNPGGGGGGQSAHTRAALIALMCAIERDNAESPRRAHPHFS